MTNKKPFTLIEITLALGVVAVGVVAILGLFPVGTTASRDAMAETSAAESVDELTHMLEHEIRNNWTQYVSAATPLLETGTPDSADRVSYDLPSDYTAFNARETVWMYGDGTNPTKRFKVIRYVDRDPGTDGEYDPGVDILDFDAILVVWRSQVQVGGSAVPYDIATALHAEVSWPAGRPYDARQKERYYFEIFKRN